MPYLGDLIGHLLAEITIGRAHADIESMRVAELYADHPLLKHLTVPRFRLPDITLDVPFAIVGMEEVPKGEEPRGKLGRIPELFKAISNTISLHLQQVNIRLSESQSGALLERIENVVEDMTRIKEVPIDLTSVADRLASEAFKSIPRIDEKIPDTEKRTRLQRQLLCSIRRDLLSFMETPPRLMVVATTKDLAEIKETGLVVRLHLTASEEGLEWTIVGTKDRLVIE